MPRLLCVCAVSAPGGAEVVAVRLLRRLAARGWAVTLTSPGAGPLRDTARAQAWGWSALPLGGLGRGRGARAAASLLRARRLAAGHDAVLLNGGVAGRVLPAVAGAARTALFVHDLVDRVPRHWRRADVVLANSGAVARRLAPLCAEVVGVPVELDPPPLRPPWERESGAGGSPSAARSERDAAPVIGFVGRLEPRKAPLDLVRAAPHIRRARPDARIVMVGAEPFEARGYAEAVRQARGIEHFGWVDDAAGLMRHLDVLVVPSREEPLGAVAAEALAAGTPVVATRVGGLPEVVEDGVTGALVAPNRPRELAEATLRVLERRHELGAEGRRRARRYSADAFADRVERLLAPPQPGGADAPLPRDPAPLRRDGATAAERPGAP
ncbi:MAG TPA: glycosyltransferase family 4 protein [Solirubrobacteraceae bacterium]